MLVTLWRHGEAGYASLDAQRELTPCGVSHVKETAQLYRRVCEQSGMDFPALCLHSPLARTLQTATLLDEDLGFQWRVASDLLAPNCDDYISGAYLDESQPHQLLVGHQPYLSQLIDVWCDTDDFSPLEPSGFALIRLTAPCRGGGELLHHAPRGLLL